MSLFGASMRRRISSMRGDTKLDVQHFADAFFRQEGCTVADNVFLAPRWSAIDLGGKAAAPAR